MGRLPGTYISACTSARRATSPGGGRPARETQHSGPASPRRIRSRRRLLQIVGFDEGGQEFLRRFEDRFFGVGLDGRRAPDPAQPNRLVRTHRAPPLRRAPPGATATRTVRAAATYTAQMRRPRSTTSSRRRREAFLPRALRAGLRTAGEHLNIVPNPLHSLFTRRRLNGFDDRGPTIAASARPCSASTCPRFDIPNPTASGRSVFARSRRRNSGSSAESSALAPVTPTSPTQ